MSKLKDRFFQKFVEGSDCQISDLDNIWDFIETAVKDQKDKDYKRIFALEEELGSERNRIVKIIKGRKIDWIKPDDAIIRREALQRVVNNTLDDILKELEKEV